MSAIAALCATAICCFSAMVACRSSRLEGTFGMIMEMIPGATAISPHALKSGMTSVLHVGMLASIQYTDSRVSSPSHNGGSKRQPHYQSMAVGFDEGKTKPVRIRP
ncbi:hypothetical protein PF005_g449 [Phytophthora fragariae]|uniref:Secreted protein n=1 Tax=Phytophthora fragariae TaxID=53985 RepID=A0A6A4ALB7_9STRA|nr:hypothetical protein PF009_g490 [Phytophthora fragariae]KAE9031197.1 hypothetical protein PF011_g269 [Phytophthora fragariae]KAE9140975.1 hypothetical protein PF007_g455 [Phytophthora fragariae]KAE9155783.1 hypothetical protein PF006_g324 [Phytophthora fragariae]KAE9237983.1 hypothetical protein PF005_g449 [Phytophthora fragariae]